MSEIQRIAWVTLLAIIGAPCTLLCRNIMLEFKSAYFKPTAAPFKNINSGSAIYGPELTIQLCEDHNWYGFMSIDYYQQKGRTQALCTPTKVQLLPLGIGLKYLGSYTKHADLYAGLGLQPVYVRTKNKSPYVAHKQSLWGFGGIAKAGTFIYLPHNLILDLFIDYSFAYAGSCKQRRAGCSTVIKTKANLSGVMFGAGFGYCF